MRAALVLFLAVAALALAGQASAAEPLIGGKLSAYGDYATVTSNATMVVEVSMTGDKVSVTPLTFLLSPGQTQRVALAGPSVGNLSAHLVAVGDTTPGDSASVTLQVTLKPAPADWSGMLWGLLGLAFFAVILFRVRPWQYRIARKASAT